MKERQLNKKKYISFIIIALLIAGYSIYSAYKLVVNPTDTFVVEKGNISIESNLVGYIIREESILKGENYKNGIYQIKSEGEKVANGEAVFRYFTSGEEEIKKKIQELDIKIAEAWEKENTIFSSDVKILEDQISKKLDSMFHLGDLQKINEYKKDLDTYITKG